MNPIQKIKDYQLCTGIQSEQEAHQHVPASHRPRFMNQIMTKNRNFKRNELKKKTRARVNIQSKNGVSTKDLLISQKQKSRKKQKENKDEEVLQTKITFIHGNKIEGTWKNGGLHGHVIIEYETGQYFEGTYANGIRTEGKVKFKDGTEYTGGFLKDIFHGQGSLKDLTGRIITCQWKQGQPGRKAKIQYPSGDIYFGQIFNLKKHGQGHLFFKNGSKYVGKFVNGEITGNGTYYQKDRKVAEGIWQNGVLQVEQNVKQIILQSLKNQKIMDLQLSNQLKIGNYENPIHSNNNMSNRVVKTQDRKCSLKI